jgi:glycosyl transferase family 25
LDVYCINMASRPDRWQWMESQFRQLGLEATRIEAIVPTDLSAEERDLYCNPMRIWSIVAPLYCAGLSHRRVWERVAEGPANWALVLEDDAILSRSLPTFLKDIDESDARFSLIRIEQFEQRPRHFGPIETTLPSGIALRRARFRDAGSAGYVLSKRTAPRLLAEPSFYREQIDAFLFNPHSRFGRRLDVVYTDPALCIQLEIAGSQRPERKTDISQSYAAHRRQKKANPLHRVARQLVRWIGYDRRRALSRVAEWWRGDNENLVIRFKPD